MTVNAVGHLVSRRVASPPAIDGQVDAVWTNSVPLRLPLTWGWGGTEHALDVELRALHTDEAVYFLAQWPGEPLPGEEDTVFNKLTVHWRIPEPAMGRLDCNVACHTAFADGQGRFVYANAETIPQGGSEALPTAGGWNAGTWTLEWSRLLVNSNPFDLQFTDLDQTYGFLVKVFERVVTVDAYADVDWCKPDGCSWLWLRLLQGDIFVDGDARVVPDVAVDSDYASPMVLGIGRPNLRGGIPFTNDLHDVANGDA